MNRQKIIDERDECFSLMAVLMPLMESGNHALALQYIEEKKIPYFRFGLLMGLIMVNPSTSQERKMQFMTRLIQHAAHNPNFRVFSPSHN